MKRFSFYMINNTTITVELGIAASDRLEAALEAPQGDIGRLSFAGQKAPNRRLGEKTVTVGVNFAHVISWTVEKL